MPNYCKLCLQSAGCFWRADRLRYWLITYGKLMLAIMKWEERDCNKNGGRYLAPHLTATLEIYSLQHRNLKWTKRKFNTIIATQASLSFDKASIRSNSLNGHSSSPSVWYTSCSIYEYYESSRKLLSKILSIPRSIMATTLICRSRYISP